MSRSGADVSVVLSSSSRFLCFCLSLLLIFLTSSPNADAVDSNNFKKCDQSAFCRRQRNYKPTKSPYVADLSTLSIIPNQEVSIKITNVENSKLFHMQLFMLTDNTVRLKVNEASPIKPRYEVPDVIVKNLISTQFSASKQEENKTVVVTSGNHKIQLMADPFRLDIFTEGEPVFSINSRHMFHIEHLREKPTKEGIKQDKKSEEGGGGLGAAITGLFRWTEDGKREPVDSEDAADGGNVEDAGAAKEEGEAGKNEESNIEKRDVEAQQEEEEEGGDSLADHPDNQDGMWEESFKSHRDSKPRGPESIGADVSFVNFAHVYGIPEHADHFALQSTIGGEPYRLYNLDVFEYELDSKAALYGSVPFMIGHNSKRTVGMLWLNSAETWIDVDSSKDSRGVMGTVFGYFAGEDVPEVNVHWMSESGIIDIFFFLGPTPHDVMNQYTSLTGMPYMPPHWAIAYHQSRWNYNDEEDVKSVDSGFDENDIPYDCLWLDIEHTDGKRYFTWDSKKFPNPEAMQNNIAAKGRKMVTIIDPHIKVDSGYHIYSQAQSKDLFVKNAHGSEFQGWCWPGNSAYLDFTRADVRAWWASQFTSEFYKGSTPHLFTWNDMNEPSVFNGPEITMFKDNIHHGGWEHRHVHNLYGMYLQRATAEGQLVRSNGNERPFVLTRSFFTGSQRFGAMWTGDNTAEWSHLRYSVPMLLSVGLGGISHCGADIGGFFKNPDPELLTRWYQAAAYQPFMRAHAHIDTPRREPWLYDEIYKNTIRESLRRRYELLPYWYTLFYQSHKTGLPVMRPLWFEFPQESEIFASEDSFMIGDALLVRPVVDPGTTSTTVFLPGTQGWYDVDTCMKFPSPQSVSIATPLQKIPVFQRAGTIIPRKMRVRRCSTLMLNDPITLFVALDSKGKADGYLYIDDGHSMNFEKQKQFLHKHLVFENNKLSSSDISLDMYKTESWLERVVIMGARKPSKITLDTDGVQSDLGFVYDASIQKLTIRKPGVNVGKNWTITIS
uniref:neutral alpha-glucosidase AB-like isoform X1 n=1 Tax=Styela clava TaxID=7725 RepID=UPI0019392CAD|nr:neutral alpha-glucosidase AB-like isoform X1 [Styela clava]